MSTIEVRGESPYPVVIERGSIASVADRVPRRARTVAVLHPEALAAHAVAVRDALRSEGREAVTWEVPDAEAAKDVRVLATAWEEFGRIGLTRSDAIVSVGGGATTDLGGFAAATWLRGVDHVAVPTTLLGMVDAAVGGKTGINTRSGKNLVGAFHPPVAVVCDPDLLATLPAADYRAGLAEVVKAGLIADPVILDLIEDDPASAARAGNPAESELIERAIAVKAAVVSTDLRESLGATGRPGREALNYGHTFAHAIEVQEDYAWRHGDAVAVGLVFAAELARAAGILDDAVADRHARTLAAVGLPVSYSGGDWPGLLAAMGRDKKARGDVLRFIVLRELARPEVLEAPSPELLGAAYARVATPGVP